MKTELEIEKTEEVLNDFLEFARTNTDTYGIVVNLRESLNMYIQHLKTENLKIIKGPSAFDNAK